MHCAAHELDFFSNLLQLLFLIIAATKEITIKCEKLIEQLDNVVSKSEVFLDFEKEKFLFGTYVMKTLKFINFFLILIFPTDAS